MIPMTEQKPIKIGFNNLSAGLKVLFIWQYIGLSIFLMWLLFIVFGVFLYSLE